MEEKGRWVTVGCFLRLNSGKHQCFGLAFHSAVTLRVFYYAPPDTREPGLRAVAFEYLQSIEGAGRICWSAPFCGVVFLRGEVDGGRLVWYAEFTIVNSGGMTMQLCQSEWTVLQSLWERQPQTLMQLVEGL